MKNLTDFELLHVIGGNDNCPMLKGQPFGYYVGYLTGWLVESISISAKI